MTGDATAAGSVERIAGTEAWRARDRCGRLLGVYPSEAEALRALASGAAPADEPQEHECASPPCFARFE